jgi:hypothetical protein
MAQKKEKEICDEIMLHLPASNPQLSQATLQIQLCYTLIHNNFNDI